MLLIFADFQFRPLEDEEEVVINLAEEMKLLPDNIKEHVKVLDSER